LVRDLSHEAIDFVEKHELVTIPAMVKEDYWEEAMTPQMQLVNPVFTGGATIQASSPASSQTNAERLESMRGSNIFFARATVFHELIPVRHMQQYRTQRYRTCRSHMVKILECAEGLGFGFDYFGGHSTSSPSVAPRSPTMHLGELARVLLPDPRPHHPSAHRLLADMDAVPFDHLLVRRRLARSRTTWRSHQGSGTNLSQKWVSASPPSKTP
jgi:hypothetical protein